MNQHMMIASIPGPVEVLARCSALVYTIRKDVADT
jgi:hypothetical protein